MNIHEYSPRTEKISGSEEARLPHYRPFDDQFKLSPSPGLPSTEADHSAILTPSSITTALPTIPEYEATTSTEPLIQNGLPPITTQQVLEASSALAPSGTPALKQPASIAENTASVNPALLLTNYDKRKSSPAVLGLPLDMQNEDDQLSLHLSEPRNSIEAAMLLANFNRLEKSGSQSKGTRAWQDDMSIASQTRNKNTWLTDENGIPTGENEVLRRHSYDVNMSWNSMPSSFLARSDLLPNLAASSAQQQQPPPAPAVEATASKLSWTHDGSLLASTPSDSQPGYTQMYEFTQHLMSGRPAPDAYPAGLFSPVACYGSPQQQRQQYHGPVYDQYRQGTGMKRKQPDVTTPYMAQYSPHPHQQPLPPPPPPALLMQPDPFYNSPQIGGVHTSPAATTLQEQTPRQSPARSIKRRRNKAEENEEDVVEPGDPEFPDMSLADLEAAKKNPEARPRKQKLRFPDDQYTPRWVRYSGQAKEGLCDTCKPGKWLQLKNSAYWYHKQFFHGISSVSGKEFIQPLEKRWINEDVMEGLCHQCGQWVAVTNNKRKNSVLWYRHAHKCHVYNKPKGDSSSRKR